jgi:hypothetical protein
LGAGDDTNQYKADLGDRHNPTKTPQEFNAEPRKDHRFFLTAKKKGTFSLRR